MEIIEQHEGDCYTLNIKGDMNIYGAMENKALFDPYFSLEGDMHLHLSEVHEFDSSGFQMLLLLERQARRQNKAFRVVDASAAVEEVISLFGKRDWID